MHFLFSSLNLHLDTEAIVETFIERGTRFSIEVGTEVAPKIIRWTSWGNGPFQQSYALVSADGITLVDPVRPKMPEVVDALDQYLENGVVSVVSTPPFHQRHVFWFRQRYGAPVYIPEKAAENYEGKRNELYGSGDEIPGGCTAVHVGGENEEMVLLWKASPRKAVLIAGDAINGQTESGGFDGALEAPFHQVGGIRLRLEGRLTAREMRRKFEPLLDHTFHLILSGHNPKGITKEPKEALNAVLASGKHEVLDYKDGVCTFLWRDLRS